MKSNNSSRKNSNEKCSSADEHFFCILIILAQLLCLEPVHQVQDVFVEAMQSGEGLKLTGLFSAERVRRAERTGRNPRTGETIKIPASYGVRISAGSLLKKAVAE